MEVQCLSVPNPRSYLLCAGIADVENRGFDTDYRGTIYIHSTGRRSIAGMPEMDDFPVPVIREFNQTIARVSEADDANRYIGVPDEGVRIILKNEETQSNAVHAEYALLSDVYRSYRDDPKRAFFLVRAIIGTVELVDVVDGSSSAWAEDGYHHWIVRNAVLFDDPITGVGGSRTGLWKYEIDE